MRVCWRPFPDDQKACGLEGQGPRLAVRILELDFPFRHYFLSPAYS